MNLSASELFRRLYYGMEDVPSWNPTVLETRVLRVSSFFKIQTHLKLQTYHSTLYPQKIDSHTDITYSVAAPAAGGLVESRDFVDLRHWQLMENCNFVDQKISASDQLTSVNELLVQTKENVEPVKNVKTVKNVKKSSSEMNLVDDNSAMDQSINSLSKSLGAGVFSDVEPTSSPTPEWYKSKSDDVDEYVDASESHDVPSTTESPHRSEEAEPIQDIVNDFCDKMYIVSGTSIKYDAMPEVSKPVR